MVTFIRLLTRLILMSLLWPLAIYGQGAPQSYSYVTPPPPAVTAVSVARTGNAGNATYYVWVVANYPIGQANATSGTITQAPDTLTATNYITVNWTPLSGAISYDILVTTTASLATPCTCGYVRNVSGSFSQVINSDTRIAYTLKPVGSASATVALQNMNNSDSRLFADTPLNLPRLGKFSLWSGGGAHPIDELPPSGSPFRLAIVQNGSKAAGDCATLGSDAIMCIDIGSKWDIVSGSGGGGGTVPAGVLTSVNNVGADPGTSNATIGPPDLIPPAVAVGDNIPWSQITGFTYAPAYTSVAYASSITFPITASAIHQAWSVNLTGNVSSATLSGTPIRGNLYTFRWCQDSVGSRTPAYPSGTTGAGGIDPTGLNCTTQTFTYNGTALEAVSTPYGNGANAALFGSFGVLLLPNTTNDTVSVRNFTETLTNKTLLAPNLSSPSTGTTPLTITLTNDTSTGTTQYRLAKMTGANAIIVGTSDSNGALGPVNSNAGTSGSAEVSRAGIGTLYFDGAATAGNYAQISTTTPGAGHDVGSTYPTSGQVLGIILQTIASAGTAKYLIRPEVQTVPPIIRTINFTLNGGSSAIATGQYIVGQLGAIGSCNITGWSLIKQYGVADGTITAEVDIHSNTAPPAVPGMPNTTTDKASASAPMSIASGSSASGGASAVSTWSKLRSSWDTIAINVTGGSLVGVQGTIWCLQVN